MPAREMKKNGVNGRTARPQKIYRSFYDYYYRDC